MLDEAPAVPEEASSNVLQRVLQWRKPEPEAPAVPEEAAKMLDEAVMQPPNPPQQWRVPESEAAQFTFNSKYLRRRPHRVPSAETQRKHCGTSFLRKLHL